MLKHTISERENVLRVINRSQDPEWIPIDQDCIKTVFSSVIQERPVPGTDGKDLFGCDWIWDANCLGFAPDVRNPPILDDITKWREVVKFPDLNAIDWKAAAEKDLADYDRNEKLLRIFMESGPFERSHHLLGFQNAFLSMIVEPEEYKALIDEIADYKVKLINKYCEFYKPDEIFFQDDLGTAKGPMMSLDMYHMLLKPAHKRIGEAIRANGVIYNHHSCGRMEAFIDDLIENGAQIINPIQPVNDQSALAQKYSGSVCFEVGADTMASYPDSSEEDIRSEVRKVIDTFGPYKNLLVICYPSNAKCLSKVDIALDELRSYGSKIYSTATP